MSDAQTNDTVEAQVENALPEGEQTIQDSTASAGETGEDGKNEAPNPYAEKLKEMERKEKEYQETIARKDDALKNKSRALKELKGQKDSADENDDDLADKILARLEAKQAQKEFLATVDTFQADDAEKELVRKIKEKNPSLDFKSCLAIANADSLLELRRASQRADAHEDELAGLAASMSPKPQNKTAYRSQEYKLAESFLDAVNPRAKQFLSKYSQ